MPRDRIFGFLRPVAAAPSGDDPTVSGLSPLYRDGHYIRLLERSNRVLSSLAAITTAGFTGACVVVLSLFPLKEKEIVFVRFDSEEARFVRVMNSRIDKDFEEQLIENTLREYVKKREEIDHVTETVRYAWVQYFTDPQWYEFWRSHMQTTNPNSPLVLFARAGLSREVHVTAVLPIPGVEGGYQVDYTTIDREQGAERQRGAWTVTLTAYRQSVEGKPHVAETNPLGLTIASYSGRARTLPNAPPQTVKPGVRQ